MDDELFLHPRSGVSSSEDPDESAEDEDGDVPGSSAEEEEEAAEDEEPAEPQWCDDMTVKEQSALNWLS